ncbi:MAG: MlaD protein [Candidatus Sumerlaeota bacterium]|nr:MlaD protein [Candidatus Sumerlaeota bacterium]
MRFTVSRSTTVLFAVAVAFVAIVALIVWIDRANGVDYTLTFRDAHGLSAGAPVRLDGRDIGRVRAVHEQDGGVEVAVRIFPEFADTLHAPPNTTARIHSGTPVIGEPYIEVVNRGEPGEGLAKGTRVEGLEGWTEELAWKGEEKAAASWDRLVDLTRGEMSQLQLWLDTRDAGEIKDNVTTFMADFEEAAASKADGARESLAGLFARAREIGGEMRRSPEAQAAAQDVERTLETVLESSQDLSEEARGKLEDVLEELRSASSGVGKPGS